MANKTRPHPHRVGVLKAQVIQLAKLGSMTGRDIARAVGVHECSVYRWTKRSDLKLQKLGSVKMAAIELSAKGATITEVVQVTGAKRKYIRKLNCTLQLGLSP